MPPGAALGKNSQSPPRPGRCHSTGAARPLLGPNRSQGVQTVISLEALPGEAVPERAVMVIGD